MNTYFSRKIFFFTALYFLTACNQSSVESVDLVEPDSLTLLLSSTQGGKIENNSNNTLCPTNCNASFSRGATVELIATPDLDYTFDGWEGDCDGQTACAVKMDNNKNVKAVFSEASFNIDLTITIAGEGIVSIKELAKTCQSTCHVTLTSNSQYTIQIAASPGYTFDSLQGACPSSSSDLPTQCVFDTAQLTSPQANITASFSQIPVITNNDNTFTITNPTSVTEHNIPIQIARPFLKGKVLQSPEVVINDKVITTQADIKQRHDDGSVKHAVLSFILPTLAANETITANFIDTTPTQTEALSQAAMLDPALNFQATMQFSTPLKTTVSAREMIENGDFTYWLSGPIATTIILADHSSSRRYDLGSDASKSIRPIFHVTFWPTINKYSVRYIVEAVNTQALQDQVYDVELTINNQAPFYKKSAVPHQAMTRWTKKQWSTPALKTSINHNIHYLVTTKSIPNFDTSRSLSSAVIEQDWQEWQLKDKDIYDKGWWQSAMSTSGGRPDIGLYPTWAVKWLYSGDWRMQEIALKQSELASAWPIHIREGDNNRLFDFDEQVNAIGHILSMAPKARPTHWTARPDWHEIADNDKIIPITPLTQSIWRPDTAHHPDIASPQYLLTGDYFYLEEMLFSAAFVSGDNNAKGYKSTLGRGPTGSEGALYSGEIRGQGWAFRVRTHTYSITPDDMPEKAYFDLLNKNAISAWEGLYSVDNSYPENAALYQFSQETISLARYKKSGVVSPIGQWYEGIVSASYVRSDRVNTENVSQALAPWMQNFVIVALGRAKELGYQTDNLLNFAGQQITKPFAYNELPHAMFTAYIMPTLNNSNQWFNSWQTVYNQFTPAYITEIEDKLKNSRDTEHGYDAIGMAATSYLIGTENYEEAWQFMRLNVAIKSGFNSNPKWALLPRESTD